MFKKLGSVGIVAGFLVAFGLGMFVQDVVLSKWSCVYGKVGIQTLVFDGPSGQTGNLTILGEQVLCAKDWRITNTYGPSLPAEYQFEKWTPKLEWIPFYKYLGSGEGDNL